MGFSSSFWLLCQRMKELFAESRESMGSRRIAVQLRKEGYQIGRYRARKLMKQLNLYLKRKKRFVLTTDSRHKFPIAENKLNRAFSPPQYESRLGNRYNVYLESARVGLLGGSHRLVFPSCCRLEDL